MVSTSTNNGASDATIWSRSVPAWAMVVVVAIAAIAVGTLLIAR
jgi:hypothetical protein